MRTHFNFALAPFLRLLRPGILQWIISIILLVPCYSPLSAHTTTPKISAGVSHILLLKENGIAWAFGVNSRGQLGTGQPGNEGQVAIASGIIDLSAGADHSLFLKSDGTVWISGYTTHGQPNNMIGTQRIPVQISGLTGVSAIAAGHGYSLFVKADGTVWASGANGGGRMGIGDIVDATTPIKVPNLTGVSAIAASLTSSLFLKSDGSVWAAGTNDFGKLGVASSNTPVKIPNLTGIVAISAGRMHSLFLKSDGTVWATGHNQYGQLGTGNTVDLSVPTQVPLLDGVVAVAAGDGHSLYLKSDGSVWAAGYNGEGQLGNSSTISRASPVHADLLTGISSISANRIYSLFLKEDLTAWTSGQNPATGTSAVPSMIISLALKTQSLNFPTIGTRVMTSPSVELTASSDSGLPVTYTVLSGPATVNGAILTLTGVGTVSVRASQSGDATYAPATASEQTFVVLSSPSAQTITFHPPTDQVFDHEFSMRLTGSTTSGLPIIFTVTSGPANITGALLNVTGAGQITIRASQPGDAAYLPAADINRVLTVAPPSFAAGNLVPVLIKDIRKGENGSRPQHFTVTRTLTPTGTPIAVTGDAQTSTNVIEIDPTNGLLLIDFNFMTLPDRMQVYYEDRLIKDTGLLSGSGQLEIKYGPGKSSEITIIMNDGAAFNPGTAWNYTASAATAQERAFFVAEDGIHGKELWVTDGTPSGTRLVKDINPGVAESHISAMFALGEKLIFRASNGTHSGLYISDGTASGTKSVKTTDQGAPSNAHSFFKVGHRAVFSADDGVHGREWWATDGTTDGTLLLKDINPGAKGQSIVHRGVVHGGKLYFYGWDESNYVQLWVTDGTSAGTEMLTTEKGYNSATTLEYQIIHYKDRMYFTKETIAHGKELWVSDGTREGTTLFKDIYPGHDVGINSSWPTNYHVLNDKLLFFAYSAEGGFGQYLYETDGTSTGTKQIKKVSIFSDSDSFLTPFKDKLYFQGSNPADPSFGWELWVTDGSEAGTRMVKDINPGWESSRPGNMLSLGNRLIFQARTNTAGREPWVTDGAESGTQMLSDLTPGAISGYPSQFVKLGSKAYFIGSINEVTGYLNRQYRDFQLIETDGTPLGTKILKAQNTTIEEGPLGATFATLLPSHAANPVVLNDTLLFAADYTKTGNELYILQYQPVPAPRPKSIGTSLTLKAGRAVSFLIAPSSAPAGLTYHATGLPSGVTLNASTGALTGTLSATSGTYTVKYWTQLGTTKSSVRTLTWTVTPFPSALAGKFEGLFVQPSGTALPVAKLQLSVTNTGTFSGRLTHGEPGSSALSGQLTLNSAETAATLTSVTADNFALQSLKVSQSATKPLTATLRDNTAGTIVGKLNDGVKLKRFTKSKPAPWKGAYTAAFTFDQNLELIDRDHPAPTGSGYATGKVATNGTLSLKGKLADGTAFTGSCASDASATYRLFSQPHGTADNYIGGSFTLTRWATSPALRYRVAEADSLDFYWYKPANIADVAHPDGLGPLALRVHMATYVPPTSKRPLASHLGLTKTQATKLKLVATGGGLTASERKALVAPAKLTRSNTLVISKAAKASIWPDLALAPASGLLTGSIVVNDTELSSRTAPFSGVLLQLPPHERQRVLAQGFFLLPPKSDSSSATLGGAVSLSHP